MNETLARAFLAWATVSLCATAQPPRKSHALDEALRQTGGVEAPRERAVDAAPPRMPILVSGVRNGDGGPALVWRDLGDRKKRELVDLLAKNDCVKDVIREIEKAAEGSETAARTELLKNAADDVFEVTVRMDIVVSEPKRERPPPGIIGKCRDVDVGAHVTFFFKTKDDQRVADESGIVALGAAPAEWDGHIAEALETSYKGALEKLRAKKTKEVDDVLKRIATIRLARAEGEAGRRLGSLTETRAAEARDAALDWVTSDDGLDLPPATVNRLLLSAIEKGGLTKNGVDKAKAIYRGIAGNRARSRTERLSILDVSLRAAGERTLLGQAFTDSTGSPERFTEALAALYPDTAKIESLGRLFAGLKATQGGWKAGDKALIDGLLDNFARSRPALNDDEVASLVQLHKSLHDVYPEQRAKLNALLVKHGLDAWAIRKALLEEKGLKPAQGRAAIDDLAIVSKPGAELPYVVNNGTGKVLVKVWRERFMNGKKVDEDELLEGTVGPRGDLSITVLIESYKVNSTYRYSLKSARYER